MVVLTERGQVKAEAYIKELRTQREAILAKGRDTADETVLPTVADIASDIDIFGVDEDGDYFNGWGVTDNVDAARPLLLSIDVDFKFTEGE